MCFFAPVARVSASMTSSTDDEDVIPPIDVLAQQLQAKKDADISASSKGGTVKTETEGAASGFSSLLAVALSALEARREGAAVTVAADKPKAHTEATQTKPAETGRERESQELDTEATVMDTSGDQQKGKGKSKGKRSRGARGARGAGGAGGDVSIATQTTPKSTAQAKSASTSTSVGSMLSKRTRELTTWKCKCAGNPARTGKSCRKCGCTQPAEARELTTEAHFLLFCLVMLLQGTEGTEGTEEEERPGKKQKPDGSVLLVLLLLR